MLPTFLVIGAQKAGTTSLWRYLRANPDVFMAADKELRFFADDGNWHRGLDWYESQFDCGSAAAARGEASPRYAKVHRHPEVHHRVVAALPDIRLVYLVRHPVERMRSHYVEAVRGGFEWRPPDVAFRANPDFLMTSRYALQLDAWLEHVPRERVLVLRTEDLHARQAEALALVAQFLGVDDRWDEVALERRHNARPDKEVYRRGLNVVRASGLGRRLAAVAPRSMRTAVHRVGTTTLGTAEVRISPWLEAELVEELRPDLLRLKELAGPDFDAWGLA